MLEFAGAFGTWFEPPKDKMVPLIPLPDPERKAHESWCYELFEELTKINSRLGENVAIRVNSPNLGDGLILRETFKKIRGDENLDTKAFLITQKAVYKIGPLTPTALEKAEKADVGFRLNKLQLTNPRSSLNIISSHGFKYSEDGSMFQRRINGSILNAQEKTGVNDNSLSMISSIFFRHH